MLSVEKLNVRFGGLTALNDLDFRLEEGEVVGLIGPNGSGKTTLFNVISGFYKPASGRVLWRGQDIAGIAEYRIARLGIARTFQNLRLFERMTLFQNVWAAQHCGNGMRPWELMLSFGARERERRQEVDHLLESTGLIDRRDELVQNLPLPEKRRLELARALARKPRLLLLDEPAGGMTPAETAQLCRIIVEVAAPSRTLMVIEHKMDMIAAICGRICALNFGTKICEGPPRQVLSDEAVLEAYLGKDGQ